MAILYGTQSNGETLPVQVNSFGQLVAQGLDGAKGEKGDKGDMGDQGDQGIEGPPGPGAELVATAFTPILSLTGDGEFVGEENEMQGVVYDFAGLTLISFSISYASMALVNIRGEPRVSGFPTLKSGKWWTTPLYQGYVNRTNLFDVDELIRIRLTSNGREFQFDRAVNNTGVNILTTDIREFSEGYTQLTGVFFGTRATAREALQQEQAASEEWPNT